MSETAIRQALGDLADRIDSLAERAGHVQIALRVDRTEVERLEPRRLAAAAALEALPGIRRATIVLTAQRHITIAVGSGKGGVGKSTVALAIARAWRRAGRRIGVLDADIHGPSLPTMLGLSGRLAARDGRLVPMEAEGLRVVSIGLMVPEDQALIWRGPMAGRALTQMLEATDWSTLDALIVDLPPGTGDVALTLARRAPLAGAVIVTTPHALALADARRAVAMFARTGVRVLGAIENMSGFVCPHCGERTAVFGEGSAAELGIPVLGTIPLGLSDTPAAVEHYDRIAATVWERAHA